MSQEQNITQNTIYATTPVIEINGQINDMVQEKFIGMDMIESEQDMSSLELSFFNSATVEDQGNDFAFEYARNGYLSLGNSITVHCGDAISPHKLFQGTITGMEMIITASEQPRLLVLAEDILQKARCQRRTKLHNAGSVADILRGLASQNGIRVSISGLAQAVDSQLQFNETDLAFMRRLASRFDADLLVNESELRIAPRNAVRNNTLTLEMGSQLLSVRVFADVAHQVSEITFSGWDVSAGDAVRVSSNAGADMGPGRGREGRRFLEQMFAPRKEHIGHTAAQNRAEAQELVNASYSDRARKFVRALGTSVGNPLLRVGTHLTLQGIGPRFSNTYFVTKTHHRFDTAKGYQTDFTAYCAYLGE